MAELYSKNDTFLCIQYGNDIATELDIRYKSEKDRKDFKNELKIGLEFCFEGMPYTKTKDNLYVGSGKYSGANIFYYEIYIPDKTLAVSVRSNKNDTTFSNRSKWLLAQVRLHRKEDAILTNEKGESCLDPYDPHQKR